MSSESAGTIVGNLKHAAGTDTPRLLELLDQLNARIRKNGIDSSAASEVRFSALARLVEYYGLALNSPAPDGLAPTTKTKSRPDGETDEEAASRKTKLLPAWKAMRVEFNAFVEAIGHSVFNTLGEEDDSLRAFARFETWRRGKGATRFYAALAAFAAHLDETGRLKSPFQIRLTPSSERSLPATARAALDRLVRQSLYPSDEDDARLPRPGEGKINLSFDYHSDHAQKFLSFQTYFSVPEDGCAHFVIYRPSKKDPDILVKSFLAIQKLETLDTHAGQERRFKFAHIYEKPKLEAGGAQRISLGNVLPLEGGSYLIGGQREEGVRAPFKTMKVIALPNGTLEHCTSLSSILVMSSNFDGDHLVSRAALRATPVTHSDKLRLGGVATSDLYDDLQRDFLIEKEAYAAALDAAAPGHELSDAFKLMTEDNIEARLRDRAREIMKLCNNNPTGAITLAPNYLSVGKKKAEVLTIESVNHQLVQAFGSRKAPRFRQLPEWDPQGDPFDFWQTIRFGPISE